MPAAPVHLLVGGPFDGRQVHLGALHLAHLRLPVTAATTTWVSVLPDVSSPIDARIPVAVYRRAPMHWGVDTSLVVLIFDRMESP